MTAAITPNDLQLAQLLWDYNALEQPLEKSEVILVFGSNDLYVADRAAELYREGWAPWLVVSGNAGRSSRNSGFSKTEAEILAARMMELGVPEERILLEKRATNTGENIALSLELMAELGHDWQKFILLQAPYMQRRAVAAFRRTQPTRRAISTTVQVPFLEYPHGEITRRHLLEMLVADTQRLEIYAEKGFLIKSAIPPEVWAAFEQLRDRGYDRYVI